MQKSQPLSVLPEPKGKSRRTLILALAISSFGFIPLGIIANYCYPYFAFNDLLILIVVLMLLAAPVFGISAWLAAIKDLKRIREGIIPASAYRVTKLGQTFGIIGAVGDTFVFFVFLLRMFSFSDIPPGKDTLVDDLNNIFASAYQYRIRPTSIGGGGGSYKGYTIPGRVSTDKTGIYTAIVFHADTIQFTAKLVADSASTIIVKVGPDGRSIEPWTFNGKFQR